MGYPRLALTLSLASLLGLAPAPLAAHRAGAQGAQTAAPKTPPPAAAGQKPAAPPAGDQAQAEQDQQPTFKAGINFVRVDVIVTDHKGNPVMDLKPEDFQVWEDGKPQTVESFKLFKIDALTETTPARQIRSTYDEETEAQRPDVRLFAFFLDDYHVRRGNSMFARQYLSRFVLTQLAPQDMVSIMYPLMPTDSVVMSRNHEALAKALEQFDGRKYNYTPQNMYEEQYASYPTTTIEDIRNDVSLSAIKGLIIKLGGLREGRKALILVSEGYTNYLPPQMRRTNAQQPGTEITADPFAGDGTNADRERFFDQAEMIGRLKDIYDLANRYNVSIYAVDPRGLAAFDSDIDEGAAGISLTTDAVQLRNTMDSIRILADNTDGRAIVNSNDLMPGLKQIVRDQSAYYLLGYNSNQAKADGKFHEIKVKVKRPGVEVRARKGWLDFTPEDLKRATAPSKPDRPKDVDQALGSIVLQNRGDYIRSWMGMSRGTNGKTRITYVWEPKPLTPGDRRHADPSHVTLTVIGTDGAPYYRGHSPQSGSSADDGMIPISGPAPAAGTGASSDSPAKPRVVTFEVPPGRVQMKVQVEDDSNATLDSDARELTVPDLSSPDVGLSTPAVFRARTQPEADKLAADPRAVPAIARDFRRTERLVVRVQAYGPGTEIPDVTARLLNRAGDAMETLPVPVPPAGGQVTLQVPLANLAPGEYVLELKAKGQGGEAKQLVGFRVTS